MFLLYNYNDNITQGTEQYNKQNNNKVGSIDNA